MRKPRIIIFDDNATVLTMLNCYFSVMNCEVQTFDQAVLCPACDNVYNCVNPCADIIITDFQMPRINGIDLLHHHVQRKCPINIQNKAIMSAESPDNYIDKMKGLADTYFQKPFCVKKLNAWTQECISRSDLSQPLGNYFV